MTNKISRWTGGILIGIIGWLLLEVIASFIHVWMIKKFAVCPFIAPEKEK